MLVFTWCMTRLQASKGTTHNTSQPILDLHLPCAQAREWLCDWVSFVMYVTQWALIWFSMRVDRGSPGLWETSSKGLVPVATKFTESKHEQGQNLHLTIQHISWNVGWGLWTFVSRSSKIVISAKESMLCNTGTVSTSILWQQYATLAFSLSYNVWTQPTSYWHVVHTQYFLLHWYIICF